MFVTCTDKSDECRAGLDTQSTTTCSFPPTQRQYPPPSCSSSVIHSVRLPHRRPLCCSLAKHAERSYPACSPCRRDAVPCLPNPRPWKPPPSSSSNREPAARLPTSNGGGRREPPLHTRPLAHARSALNFSRVASSPVAARAALTAAAVAGSLSAALPVSQAARARRAAAALSTRAPSAGL